jgi:hypothetical protein
VVVAGVVHLEGGVLDAEVAGEDGLDVAAAVVAVLRRADEDVGGEGRKPLVIVQMCRSWTSSTPGTEAISRPTFSASTSFGVDSSRMFVDSRRSFQELPRITDAS